MMKFKKLLVLSMIASVLVLASCVDSSDEIQPKSDASPTASSPASNTGSGSAGSSYDDLTSLPADTGGEHIAKQKGTTVSAYGYYIYLPAGYKNNTKNYPLLVFLHGKGERGNGTSELGRVLNTGIPNLIKNNKWKTKPRYPMIVVSPQYDNADGKGNDNNWGEGDPSKLKAFIEHVATTYRVNKQRIYLTGLSHGGNGVYDYLILQSDATSHVAAAAPIAAWGPNKNYSMSKNTPIWVFCGGTDGSITNKYGNLYTSLNYVTNFNKQSPAPKYKAKFTVYPGVGHNSWMQTYDLTGMTSVTDPIYDPYSTSLYDWMFQYKRASY